MSAQTSFPYIEKELSWLSFNERVLQEAADPQVPVIERVRFLGIYSNNQDEFFRVRVADVRRQILIDESKGRGQRARNLLAAINDKVLQLQVKFDEIYKQLLLDLARRNIFLVNETQISAEQGRWLKKHFRDKIRRHIVPLIITDHTNISRTLNDGTTYLVTAIRKGEQVTHSLIEVPTQQVPRFVQLSTEGSKKKTTLILLDNIIRYCLAEVFTGFFEFDTVECYSIKLTRDAEYDLSDEIEMSLMEKMSSSLKQRLTAEPVSFVYDREMPQTMLEMLQRKLGITAANAMIPGGRYHSFRDFIAFPNPGRAYLENPKMPALRSNQFTSHPNTFAAIRVRDILLYYPYHAFSHVTEMLRQAAFDPAVRSIKINIYRVAKHSQIVHSLIEAVKNGKDVAVVVELQARFDEEANIGWAKFLTDHGVRINFGIPTLKIHSKLILIKRMEEGQLHSYAHIGTGNFHEKTAKIYTDFALFTCHEEICAEVENVFEFIEHSYKKFRFNHLLVSPNDARRKLYSLVDREIQNKLAGKNAGITLKLNNLVDSGLIKRLYDASRNGVKVRLIIRGMCSLIPGVIGASENIEAISIVDRFLEHPRIMVFDNDGDPKVYLSSADWMTRNLDRRIEVGCPIYDPMLKQQVLDILALQFRDTTKARVLNREQSNQYVKRGNRKKIRSQMAIYDYLFDHEKRLALKTTP
ncbi:polyphosphate kinase 1 [Ferrimonas sediminicola]|uniref:Polyphosphate kinase n=1 Tax=Ferrimonas sediminicola TaxID=2569538 RepID=A0A4U1BEF4_9GAMM|nr:polyphosphate kinase 1 [Ferrimonas sediminicola]TKB49442.1 polyphosphate kinase 1 [Ferrimonas sediminicola]